MSKQYSIPKLNFEFELLISHCYYFTSNTNSIMDWEKQLDMIPYPLVFDLEQESESFNFWYDIGGSMYQTSSIGMSGIYRYMIRDHDE